MEKKNVTCIVCPYGCDITVKLKGNEVVSVDGQGCKRGIQYAIDECLHPIRMVASTVKTFGALLPVAAVRTDRPIPKEKVVSCMEEIRSVTLCAPFKIGDVVIENVSGTDANIIVTRSDIKSE